MLAAYNSECLWGSDTQADRWLTVCLLALIRGRFRIANCGKEEIRDHGLLRRDSLYALKRLIYLLYNNG